MEKYINKLLREGIYRHRNAVVEKNEIRNLFNLVEKKIRVGDNIAKKLNAINTPLSKNLLNFINSDDIKDDANVDYVDYDKKNEKLFTIGYEDQRGNTKERLMKFNKLITYLGGSIENIKGYEVEDLMNHLKQADLDNFKIVDGEDILWAYHCKNYDEGETMGSCMRYDSAQAYLDIYVKNPNQIKCLVLINPENNKVRGRALLWKCDDGSTFLDRVYVTNKQYRVEFNNYIEEHNLETDEPSDVVTLENGGDYEYYPYTDTFKYYSPQSGVFSTNYGDYYLDDTDGGPHLGLYSEYLDRHIPEDEAIYIDHLDSFMPLDDCERSYDDSEWLYIEHDDVGKIEHGYYEGRYAKNEDLVTTYDDVTILIDDSVYLDKGEYVHEYAYIDDTVSDYEGEFILSDEAVELTLGKHEGEYCIKVDAVLVLSSNNEVYGILSDVDDYSEYEEGGYRIVSYDEYYN